MELSNRIIAFLFAALSALLLFRGEETVDQGKDHGVWRGELTTVTAKGAMLSTENGNFWVSHRSLAPLSLRGDSLLVIGYRNGMFISPFSIRLKTSGSFFSSARRSYRERLFATISDPVARGLTGGLIMGLRGLILKALPMPSNSQELPTCLLFQGSIPESSHWCFCSPQD